jgi:hypothetical protein
VGHLGWKSVAGTILIGVGVATAKPPLIVAGGLLIAVDVVQSIYEGQKKGEELGEQYEKIKKPERDRIKELMDDADDDGKPDSSDPDDDNDGIPDDEDPNPKTVDPC